MCDLNLTQSEIKILIENNDNDFINSLYDLIRKFLHKNKWYNEDNLQECITNVICKINRFDSEKSKFSTFACMISQSTIRKKMRDSNALKRKGDYTLISLDSIKYQNNNGDIIEFIDTIEDENIDREKEDKKELIQYIYDNLLSDMSKDWIDGKNQMDIAKEYNLTQSIISRKIKKEFQDIKIKLNL